MKTRDWMYIGLGATLISTLCLAWHIALETTTRQPDPGPPEPDFVGSAACRTCHPLEYGLWQGSHHERAMDIASPASVLGDFNDAAFELAGVRSTFFRRAGRYFVRTPGPDGAFGEFEVTHTFGWFPLQQYLVSFPDGRRQCLPLAWDSRDNRWFHLYPEQPPQPGEWLYWTRQGQNWNSMCADCHSTDLRKGYDPATDRYATSWSEISVGCEACHGPGSRHLAWADLPAAVRREDGSAGFLVRTSDPDPRRQVEQCALCHSRRSMTGDYVHGKPDLLDSLLPRLLDPGMYQADGQILDEVYVYGSFVQSRMFEQGIRCSDCHDVHSAKPLLQGNDLCLQCHQRKRYAAKAHHFHKEADEDGEPIRDRDGKVLFAVGTGTVCRDCHMPGRTYMGNDYRPDHSFRIPRPDLSLTIGVANACNRCHWDKDAAWSASYTAKWYGEQNRYHYGPVLAAGRERAVEAEPQLIDLVEDLQIPLLVRATALSLLAAYPSPPAQTVLHRALQNDEALLRRTAVMTLPETDPDLRAKLLSPLLRDPVFGVRIEAAKGLAGIPGRFLGNGDQKALAEASRELAQTLAYSADFAESRLNLGTLAMTREDTGQAESEFRAALAIDPQFTTARTNLAILYSRQGRNDEAESLLRAGLELEGDPGELHYSLGLLLAEKQDYAGAVDHLRQAVAAMPDYHRALYNLGRLLDFLNQGDEAIAALDRAVHLDPTNSAYLAAYATVLARSGQVESAKTAARRLQVMDPKNQVARDILRYLGD